MPELVEHVSAKGYQSLWLTDVENMYGQVELHWHCRTTTLRPLTGVELRAGWQAGKSLGSNSGRVVLLAQDSTGYAALCRVTSARRATTAPTCAPIDSLRHAVNDGLLAASDDPALLAPLAKLMGATRVLALRVYGEEASKAELEAEARRLGVRQVPDCDAALLYPEDLELHRLLRAAHLRRHVASLHATQAPARILPAAADLRQAFAHEPTLLNELAPIAAGSRVPLLEERKASPTTAKADDRRLARFCQRRLTRLRAGLELSAYSARLTRELDVIAKLGLSTYFMAIKAIVGRARRSGIALAARGSAVGSLVVHLIGTSPIDPLAHQLLFERFLHLRRAELPDVDLDVSSERREELLSWIRTRFGPRRVVQVATLQTYQRRMAYRDGLGALGAEPAHVERFLRAMPDDELLDAGHASLPMALLSKELSAQRPLIERMRGKPRHVAVHPAAVIIDERPLDDQLPLERAPKGVLVSQYVAEWVQRAGFVKLDLLGNSCLDEIAEAQRWLSAGEQAQLDPKRIQDPATLELIAEGRTLGCYQLETPTLRRALRHLPIREFTDVVAAMAVVRPGPASSRAKRAFERRARGEEPPQYWHPVFEPQLRQTHGLLLYEEDISVALATLSGIDLTAAEAFRHALVLHQNDADWAKRAYARLLKRAKNEGFEASVVSAAWRDMSHFAAYSFSKAHALSHAFHAWQMAYYKAHAPVAFACSLLNHYAGSYPMRTLAAELQRMGVRVYPPSVQRSQLRHSVQNASDDSVHPPERGVQTGLMGIKHLRRATARRIVEERTRREFHDLADLLERVPVNARELRALLWTGSCDGLWPLEATLYPWLHAQVEAALAGATALARASGEGREVLAELARRVASERTRATAGNEPEVGGANVPLTATYQRLVRVQQELSYLGMHLSDHPLRLLRPEARAHGCVGSNEIGAMTGKRIQLLAFVSARRQVPQPVRRVNDYLTLEDEFGLMEAVVAPDVGQRVGAKITTSGPYLVHACVERDLRVRVLDVLPFHQRSHPYAGQRS